MTKAERIAVLKSEGARVSSLLANEPHQDLETSLRRPDKDTAWKVIAYEIEMLRYAFAELHPEPPPPHGPPVFSALETYLLHYRVLLEFLTGWSRGTDLAIVRPDDWAAATVPASRWRPIKVEGEVLHGLYKDPIDKMLAHCTPDRYLRYADWKIGTMQKQIEPLLAEVVELL